MIVEVYIEQNKLELFNAEQIEIVQGIQDVRDISKTTTDYSKSFVVPASRINNQIFKHYYYINLDGSFDARFKVAGRIDLGGSLYKEGYFILNQVVIKGGKPFSYSITFFGSLTALSNTLGDFTLNDLNIEGNNVGSGNTAYTALAVKTRLTEYTAGASQLIYSMFSHKELIYASGTTGTTNTEKQINVAFNTNVAGTGMIWKEFYPSIRVAKVVEAIERQFNIGFVQLQPQNPSGAPFLSSPDYTNLYLKLLNPDIVANGTDGSTNQRNLVVERVDFDRIQTPDGAQYFDLVNDLITFNPDHRGSNKFDEYDLRLQVIPFPDSVGVEFTIIRYVSFNGGAFIKQTATTTATANVNEYSSYNDNDGNYRVYWEISAPKSFHFLALCEMHYHWRHGLNHPSNDNYYRVYDDDQTLGAGTDPNNLTNINTLVPTIKITELLKGLISAFNLVLVYAYNSQGINYYYLDTLDNYYNDLSSTTNAYDKIKDFTKYADVVDYSMTKQESTNEYLFKFTDPQTKLNLEYKAVNVLGYGDYLKTVTGTRNGQLYKVEGKRSVVEVPFEQVLYNRIPIATNAVNFGINLQYGGLYDKEFSPVITKPHLHYNVVSDFSQFGFIGDTFVKEQLPPHINMPHYSTQLLTANDTAVFLFNKEGSPLDITNVLQPTDPRPTFKTSLYDKWYANYINSISGEKVRLVQMKMRLPMREILNLEMNNIIKVGSNHYRINKVTTNLSTSIASFELITIV